MGLVPVPQDQVQEKPVYPYVAYKFISPYTPDRHQGNYSRKLVPSNDEKFEHDIEESLELQPQMTLSISAYCKGKDDNHAIAHGVAKKMADWFRHVGYQYLSDMNLVVVSVEAFGDRSALIVSDYEVRYGFDIILRVTDTIKRRIETIEESNIEKEIN